MILAIDAGNTTTVLGLFRGYKLVYKRTIDSKLLLNNADIVCSSKNRYSHDLYKAVGAIEKRVRADSSKIRGVCVSSVVPDITKILMKITKDRFKSPVFTVDSKTLTGINLKVKNPRELGADRIVNAAGAYHYFERACIVVDMGTATTLDCVDEKGNYVGGLILPGVGISARALHSFTARLPSVEFKKPKRVIGRDTVECIRSGMYYGNIGMIEKSLDKCGKELGGNPVVILTGGAGEYFFGAIKGIKYYWQDLTLIGLRLIWEINKGI